MIMEKIAGKELGNHLAFNVRRAAI